MMIYPDAIAAPRRPRVSSIVNVLCKEEQIVDNCLFANLSVNKKLVWGLALILLMTFFVTSAGMQHLERLIVRSEKMGAITELNKLVQQARVLRLQFEVTAQARAFLWSPQHHV